MCRITLTVYLEYPHGLYIVLVKPDVLLSFHCSVGCPPMLPFQKAASCIHLLPLATAGMSNNSSIYITLLQFNPHLICGTSLLCQCLYLLRWHSCTIFCCSWYPLPLLCSVPSLLCRRVLPFVFILWPCSPAYFVRIGIKLYHVYQL